MHSGDTVRLRWVREEYDPGDRARVVDYLLERQGRGEGVTGLLYVEPEAEDFSTRERLPERPLRDYAEDELRLTREQFDEVMAEMA